MVKRKAKYRWRLRVLRHNALKDFRNRIKRQKMKIHKRAVKWERYRLNRKFRLQAKTIHSFSDTLDMFLPMNVKYLLSSCRSPFYAPNLKRYGKNKSGIVRIPKDFSIITNPKESYQTISKVLACFVYQCSKEVRLDYSCCEKIDLVTMVFLDAILKDIDDYLDLCKKAEVLRYIRLVGMGGYHYYKQEINKMINSVGSPAIITKRRFDFDEVIPFRLLCFDSHTASETKKLQQKEIDTTKVLEYINKCLNRFHKSLSNEAMKNLGYVVGETLINAEEHSSTGYRYMIGYMEDKKISECKHSGVFNLVIMNFGQTIYEKFKMPSNEAVNQECLVQMKNLSDKFMRRSLFAKSFKEETLWTLYTLQQGVTCVPEKKRGNGTIQFIESFFKLKGNDEIDDVSRMYILSGNTVIEFDGTYHLSDSKDENGVSRGIISFNKSGSLNEKPDSKYVKNVDEYFPGTAIFVRLLLNDNDIITEQNEYSKN